MSTDAVIPLRHRMIEDMNAPKLCAGTRRAAFTAASGLLRFSIGRPTSQRPRISAGFSCT
jgi:hypothetical protein